jgi:hypothetical protein
MGPERDLGSKFKLGLDIHGVIDTKPWMFSRLSKSVIGTGGEVHIITGAHMTEELKTKLKDEYEMSWTHLFSIADHHKSIGTEMRYKKSNNPWMDKDLWDRTKGDYCHEQGIMLHIDDTERYAKYFLTPFILVDYK